MHNLPPDSSEPRHSGIRESGHRVSPQQSWDNQELIILCFLSAKHGVKTPYYFHGAGEQGAYFFLRPLRRLIPPREGSVLESSRVANFKSKISQGKYKRIKVDFVMFEC